MNIHTLAKNLTTSFQADQAIAVLKKRRRELLAKEATAEREALHESIAFQSIDLSKVPKNFKSICLIGKELSLYRHKTSFQDRRAVQGGRDYTISYHLGKFFIKADKKDPFSKGGVWAYLTQKELESHFRLPKSILK